MTDLWVNILAVFIFVLIGGFFAAAEIALVSLRAAQVKRLAATAGKRGSILGRLERDPNRFLSTVQVGVTLAGFLAAGFGASRIAPYLTPVFDRVMPENLGATLSFLLVTLLIAYVSLVLGELVPKRLAMQRAERIALWVAAPIDFISRITRPFIWVLSVSTDALVRVFGGNPDISKAEITNNELRELILEHSSLSPDERKVINDVFEAGEANLREVMVPRTEVEFIDGEETFAEARKSVESLPFSRYPVSLESPDEVAGFVHVRDIYKFAEESPQAKVASRVRNIAHLPDTVNVMDALTTMRKENRHLAIVTDEYGGTAGIVTLEDLVEELIGDIKDEYDTRPLTAVSSPTGEIIVDGLTNLSEFEELAGFELPEGPYETVAGYVIAETGALPKVGDFVEISNHRLSVVELDGRRIARVRVRELPKKIKASEGA